MPHRHTRFTQAQAGAASHDAWRLRPAALVAAQVADLAEPPLVKPELPKMPKLPDLRGVKSEVLKASHEKIRGAYFFGVARAHEAEVRAPEVQGGAAASRSSKSSASAHLTCGSGESSAPSAGRSGSCSERSSGGRKRPSGSGPR